MKSIYRDLSTLAMGRLPHLREIPHERQTAIIDGHAHIAGVWASVDHSKRLNRNPETD